MVAAAIAGWLSLAAGEPPPGPPPSTELLLYLAEFEDAEGSPVDPLTIPEPDADTAAGTAPASPEEKADAPPDH